MTPQEQRDQLRHLAEVRAAHGLGDDRPAVVEGSTAAAPVSSFEPAVEEPLPAYVFYRSIDTGRGGAVEVVVWEDQPEAIVFYDAGGNAVSFSRDAVHALGLAIADALHRRA